MRFIGALEAVLDPIVEVLDSLFAHISADLAPHHVLELLGSWLGLVIEEDMGADVRRDLVRNAAELTRRRGTARGLELLLDLTFPGLSLRVDDGGCARPCDGLALPPDAASREFVVRSAVPLSADQRAAIANVIERERPVHVSYRLEEPRSDSGAQSTVMLA